jgi:hypothetical protein
MAIERLTLLKTNEDILLRKIEEARGTTIIEEDKIVHISNDKKILERELLSMRVQNEGTKVILRNLEEENEKLRS